MTFIPVEPDGYAPPPVPYTPVVITGDLVVTAGHGPLTPAGEVVDGDFRAQAHQVFVNLQAGLSAAGCTLADVFKVNGYLASLDDFAVYNEVYLEYFTAPLPARTTVEAGLWGIRAEVEAWARRPPIPG
ncbi:RidA family protein [Amycolatopsis jejuensis]|uniref:RidA family protein n=1 Tax=Amycolatopsis jejuensis TaxID=330084 RepID=UPI000525BE35|nr:Rid family hydrolase [Amycolatopsis jejuensis]